MYDQLPMNESDFDLDLELELAYKLNGLENDGDSAPPSRPGGGVTTGRVSGGQLSMYYGGQVGVFDNVSPEKVKDALYVLGSSTAAWVEDINAGVHKRMGKGELPGKCSQLQRLASLKRYRLKRMKRCYQKKIMYHVRQQVALRTHRWIGQFCSNKKLLDDSAGLSNNMPDKIIIVQKQNS